jgi:hypothetical protein
MASPPGLEPGTYCLEGSCSIRLSYRDAPPARRAACDGPAGREHSSIWLKMQATGIPAPRDGCLRSDVIECAIGQLM